MKKYFFSALAAVAMLNLTSCLSEEEVNLTKGETEKGYINLNLSADNTLMTRATVQNWGEGAFNASSWWVTVTPQSPATDTYSGQIGTESKGLAVTPFGAGNYTVAVSNYETLKDALEINSNLGVAYYAGSTEANAVTVTAGGTATPMIACGTAQNAALSVNVASAFSGISGATINSLTVTDGVRDDDVVFVDRENSVSILNTPAYFPASTTLNYSVNYTINTVTKTYLGTITLDRATTNTLSITSNQNGSITIQISYDDTMTQDKTQTITIDAASGNATVSTSSALNP